jgi:hypothetical protein
MLGERRTVLEERTNGAECAVQRNRAAAALRMGDSPRWARVLAVNRLMRDGRLCYN